MKIYATLMAIGGTAALLTVAPTAEAGFILETIQIAPEVGAAGPAPTAVLPTFAYEITPTATGAALRLAEVFPETQPLALVVAGETDSDPVMNVQKDVENSSDEVWYGYIISLPDGGDKTFVGTASSDKLTLLSQTDYMLIFGYPGQVNPGETITFNFDVLVPTLGLFEFKLKQQPYGTGQPPEPATIGLLTGGMLVLVTVGRRRR